MSRPTFIDLILDAPRHYTFMGSLDKYNVSFNTLDDSSSRIYVLNKTESVNLNKFNKILQLNESTTLIKHISCGCRCEFDGRKCNSK